MLTTPPLILTIQKQWVVVVVVVLLAACCLIRPFLLFPSEQSPNSNTLGYMLCVIGHIAKHLPRSTRDRITGESNGDCLEALSFTAAFSPSMVLCNFKRLNFRFFIFLRCCQRQAEWISVVSRVDQFVCWHFAGALQSVCKDTAGRAGMAAHPSCVSNACSNMLLRRSLRSVVCD